MKRMASTIWTPTTIPARLVFIFWMMSIIFVGKSVGQEVTFGLLDEINDVVVFDQETNVKLVCEASGFSNEQASVEIRHEQFGLITSPGATTSISENFTVDVVGGSTTLTIKTISDETSGRYTCAIVDSTSRADLASALYDIVVIPQFGGTQCHSPTIEERGSHIPEGGSFSADCFYKNIGTTTSKWVRIDSDGTQSDVTSDLFDVGEKFRRRFHVSSLSEADDEASYKCVLVAMVGPIMLPDKECVVGPLYVKAISSTARQTTISSTINPTTTPTAPTVSQTTTTESTTEPTSGGLLDPEVPSLYIIGGAVVGAVILFILLGICICCFCSSGRTSSGKSPSTNVGNGKPPSNGEANGNQVPNYDELPYQAKQDNLYYDSPPSGAENPGYVTIAKADPSRDSVVILGPEDMASTHL